MFCCLFLVSRRVHCPIINDEYIKLMKVGKKQNKGNRYGENLLMSVCEKKKNKNWSIVECIGVRRVCIVMTRV